MALAKNFGRPAPISIAQRRASMHEALHQDDINRWVREFSGNEKIMVQWIKDNVVHALERCPNVLEHWRKNMPRPETRERTLLDYLGAALEHLGADTKIRLLQGKTNGRVEDFFQGVLRDSATHWSMLSPGWVGPPNSALRAAATSVGWVPARLPGQVNHCLDRADSQTWAQWMPFPESTRIVHRCAAARGMMGKEFNTGMPPSKDKISAPWADPKDVALAQHLVKHAPEGLNFALKAHPDVAPLDADESGRLETMVQVHVAMGLWSQLQSAVVLGELPGEGVMLQEAVELPDLGGLEY